LRVDPDNVIRKRRERAAKRISGKGAAMDTNREHAGASPLQGNLLRLNDGREVAIYMREGAAWIAEFKDGKAGLHAAGEWFGAGHGRRLAHAQRRGEVEYLSPIPEEVVERIERLHQYVPASSDASATMVSRAIDRLATWLQARLDRICEAQIG
jgi:hypothetical protein